MTTLAQALEAGNRNHINRIRLTGAYAYIDTLEVMIPTRLSWKDAKEGRSNGKEGKEGQRGDGGVRGAEMAP